VLASVSLQDEPPNSTVCCGIQAGEWKQTSGVTTDCSPSGAAIDVVFVEVDSKTNGIACPYTSDISQFGSGGLFAVALSPAGGWEAFQNSNLIYGPINLGFPSGYSVARAESLWSVGPTMSITWGPSGQIAWQYKTASVGYTTIGTSSGDQNPQGTNYWHLGGTPSPFTIYWDGG
jgi:hypothetical protein